MIGPRRCGERWTDVVDGRDLSSASPRRAVPRGHSPRGATAHLGRADVDPPTSGSTGRTCAAACGRGSMSLGLAKFDSLSHNRVKFA
jgi:hypothetical protein